MSQSVLNAETTGKCFGGEVPRMLLKQVSGSRVTIFILQYKNMNFFPTFPSKIFGGGHNTQKKSLTTEARTKILDVSTSVTIRNNF